MTRKCLKTTIYLNWEKKIWPPDVKNWLIRKDPDAGRDWGQEGKGMTEDEMIGWHQWLDGHEFEWTPGVGDGQGGLACCDSWVRKGHNWVTELNWLNWVKRLAEGNGIPLQYSCLENPWTEELGSLQSMGSLRVGHEWANSLSLLTFMHWRRKWQPTAVFLPGESQRWGSLLGCRLWGRTESDTTETT